MKRSEWDAFPKERKGINPENGPFIIHQCEYRDGTVGSWAELVQVPGINCHARNCVDDDGKIECGCGLDEIENMRIEHESEVERS